MRFIPYEELGERPNILVDGLPNPHTVLSLSHWPKSGTPAALKADLSAEIVFNYLDQPSSYAAAEAVSNNHFDEDGLIGVYTLLEPERAGAQRKLLIDVASAGDFNTCESRQAARIAFVLARFSEAATSPLDRALFALPHAECGAALYRELLPRLPDLLARPDQYRKHWEQDEALLERSEAAIRDGRIRIEDNARLDLAVVSLPERAGGAGMPLFTENLAAVCHPMALYNATRRFRVLLMQGRTYELGYRYETWVQYVSVRPAPRVDLAPLAEALSGEEQGGARWEFDGVEEITPSLRLAGAVESSIAPEAFRSSVEAFLGAAPPAWDPYDPG
ncbi:MAG: DUF6687 family protein [Acidobacteriota bacterium]